MIGPSASCVIFGDSDPITPLLDADSNSVILLDTKYYTASVKLIFSHFSSPLPESTSGLLPVNAVVINGTLPQAKSIEHCDAFRQSDIRLFNPGPNPTKEMFDWAIENQVEIIDLVEEPERVCEALESSVWPGAAMKSDSSNHFLQSTSPSPPPTGQPVERNNDLDFDDHFADMLEEDQLEMSTLFSLVGRARAQGANMSDEERRQNAERVICAISKMLGDDLDLDP